MRKSGLQKQIASIFSDVPVPQQADPKSMRLPVQEQAHRQRDAEMKQDTQPAGDSPVQPRQTAPAAAAQTESVHTPAVATIRPKPLPKSEIVKPKQKTGELIAKQAQKVLYGSSKGQIDPRQKKMAILVGILVVVFGTVLFISLGGVGRKKSTSTAAAPETTSIKPAESPTLQQWQIPEPLPAQMRDPMQPAANLTSQTDERTGEMTVTGIVFSQHNPSAIVHGKIVRQNDTVNGVTVVSISKDSVEFEKDGKRWVQQVQH